MFEQASHTRIRFIVRSSSDPLANDGVNVIRDLCRVPKRIAAKYVYDGMGTQLFERQCDTPEYYLRRAEMQLLEAHVEEIVDLCGSSAIVELGAGTAEKTRILLAEYEERAQGRDYVYCPIDVDTETLFETARALVAVFPHLIVHCLGAAYGDGLRSLPDCRTQRLYLFLGSTIGNMDLDDRQSLLTEIHHASSPGDYFLVGADLHKDKSVIDNAYNDAAGFGARSTLNMLSHLNHRYDADFDLRNFRYRSSYESHARKNEVRIESLRAQQVMFSTLNFLVTFDAAELIDAEVMWKFDPHEIGDMLGTFGFTMARRWVDPVHRYGLFLARRQ